MKKTLFLFLLLVAFQMNAQTIFGKWEAINEDTGELGSIIEVYEKDGKAYAKIVEIYGGEERRNATCVKCKGDNKDKPILGMDILTGLKKKKDEWSGGKILDPKNGKVYKCFIKLQDENTLKLRGYIGFSLIGRTTVWTRHKT